MEENLIPGKEKDTRTLPDFGANKCYIKPFVSYKWIDSKTSKMRVFSTKKLYYLQLNTCTKFIQLT